MVFIFIFKEPEGQCASFLVCIDACAHQFVETGGEGIVEVRCAWCQDGGFGAFCEAVACLANVCAAVQAVHLGITGGAIHPCPNWRQHPRHRVCEPGLVDWFAIMI